MEKQRMISAVKLQPFLMLLTPSPNFSPARFSVKMELFKTRWHTSAYQVPSIQSGIGIKIFSELQYFCALVCCTPQAGSLHTSDSVVDCNPVQMPSAFPCHNKLYLQERCSSSMEVTRSYHCWSQLQISQGFILSWYESVNFIPLLFNKGRSETPAVNHPKC